MSAQYPWAQAWLTVKVVALLTYIGLGRVPLGNSVSMPARKVAFGGALLCVSYFICVAHRHSPLWRLSNSWVRSCDSSSAPENITAFQI